jgi:hypothetical protein
VEKQVVVETPVDRIVEVDSPKLKEDIKLLKKQILALQRQLAEAPKEVEKLIEVDKPVLVEIERAATKDLQEAARLMASSELNKEDLTETEILAILQKSSDDDVRNKLGFWAVPLPKQDEPKTDTNKRYIGKK